METLPCQGCKGLCCGPVPVSENELKRLRKKVKAMPAKTRNELKNQQRFPGTCIFYDLKKDRCGVHASRPGVCKAFGLHQNLVCFKNPQAALHKDWKMEEPASGILSIDYTWKDFSS